MSEEEFCKRFIERVRLHARSGRKPFGKEPEPYAAAIAPIYWAELGKKLSPEQCADLDADYWP